MANGISALKIDSDSCSTTYMIALLFYPKHCCVAQDNVAQGHSYPLLLLKNLCLSEVLYFQLKSIHPTLHSQKHQCIPAAVDPLSTISKDIIYQS